jgi:hypothetical protein
MGAGLDKHRRTARACGGAMAMDKASRDAYVLAVEKAVRAKQRAEHARAFIPPSPNCASGTWHTTGEEIGRAVAAQNRARANAAAMRDRSKRTPRQWQEMYDAAMQEKRNAK